jgi:hypothetical protein
MPALAPHPWAAARLQQPACSSPLALDCHQWGGLAGKLHLKAAGGRGVPQVHFIAALRMLAAAAGCGEAVAASALGVQAKPELSLPDSIAG